MSFRLRRTVVLTIGAAFAAALVPSVGQAWSLWTTNSIELDNGVCGQMLAIGSDPTASSSSRPSFLLSGDGGMSSYAMAVDGVPIGTFNSTGRGVVCVQVTTPLADGPHVLTGVELAPRPSMTVPAFKFSVDTVPPTPPSHPVLSDFSDSGAQGDGITRFGMVNMTGTADVGDRVQIWRESGAVVAGATTESNRRWSATTLTLPDGAYTLSAVTIDRAGNRSTPSNGMKLVVDSVAPATPGAPTVEDARQDGRTVVSGTAADDVATISVRVNGSTVGTTSPNGAHAWGFTLPALDPGSYSVTAAAADVAGNLTAASAAATVTVAPPPPAQLLPPPQTPPPAEEPVTPPHDNSAPVSSPPPAAAPIVVPPPPSEEPLTPPTSEARPSVPDAPPPAGPRPLPPRR